MTNSIILRPCERNIFSIFLSFDIRITPSGAFSIEIQDIAKVLIDLTLGQGLFENLFTTHNWFLLRQKNIDSGSNKISRQNDNWFSK